ncbi:MAG: hypothetical protein EXR93_10585 [Gemmatimonadetes bacterium]|nr:hypothetical protein [Gemmatimonadota bacterium]
MIRLADSASHLEPLARFGLSVLLDSSRLLPVDDPSADVVQLSIGTARAAGGGDLFARGVEPHVNDGEVVVESSTLEMLGALAGGVADQKAPERDRFERVPAHVNPMVVAGRFREPIVSRAGGILRRAAEQAAGRRPVRTIAPWPDGRRWAMALTHDLDLVAGWPWYNHLRAAQLAARFHLVQAMQVLAYGAAALGRNPVWRAVRDLLDAEHEFGLRSTWFIICGTPAFASIRAGDVTYLPESPAVKRILAAVAEGGHEIGLHGSFETMLDGGRFRAQRERLESLTRAPVTGVRQHFLRMRPGATQQEMASARFGYDSTWGFSDRNGFRLGVADIVAGWDAHRESLSGLEEAPLAWMDRALSKYAGIENPERWVDDALELARACRDVNGVWVGLWHPNLVPALGFPGAPTALRRLLDILMAGQPYAERLDRIVAWRVARRSLRATRVSPDGRAELAADRAWNGPAILEDPRGGPIASHHWPQGGA